MPETIKSSDFRINSLQGVIYCATTQIVSAAGLGKILSKVGARFDGAPGIFPFPNDAPAEIPRMILKSTDDQWGIDVALSRINYRWTQIREEQQVQAGMFRDSFLEFVELLFEMQPLIIGRMAFLLNRYAFTDNAPSIISRAFLNEPTTSTIGSATEGIELHVHQKLTVLGVETNEWTRFKAGFLTLPNTTAKKIILIEHDINTLAEIAPSKKFTFEDVRGFTENAIVEAEDRFQVLFGGRDV
jgi:hypothetical protein